MRAIRILEYEGPREWIEHSILGRLNAIHGEVCCGPGKYIREVSVNYVITKEEEKGELK